jgi:hypothetical protein
MPQLRLRNRAVVEVGKPCPGLSLETPDFRRTIHAVALLISTKKIKQQTVIHSSLSKLNFLKWLVMRDTIPLPLLTSLICINSRPHHQAHKGITLSFQPESHKTKRTQKTYWMHSLGKVMHLILEFIWGTL